MSLTPRLSRKLQQALGDEAEDLVSWMQDIERERPDVRSLSVQVARLDERFGELRETMRADMAELRQEMHAGFNRLDNKIETRTADLMKWSFVFWVGAVAAVAALAGVLR